MASLIAKYEPPPREWYENPSVVYGFNIPKVRATLEWLMGSHVVQALDKGYQQMLLQMMSEDWMMQVRKRNQDRQKEEVNREKQLVLEGKMTLEDAPEGIHQHPVIQINQLVEIMQAEKQKRQLSLASAVFDYDYTIIKKLLQLRGVQATGYGKTIDVSCCYKIPYVRSADDSPDGRYTLSSQEFIRLRPTEAQIKDLNNRNKVYQLYKKADRILGYEPIEMDDDYDYYSESDGDDDDDDDDDEEEEVDEDEDNMQQDLFLEIPNIKELRKSITKK